MSEAFAVQIDENIEDRLEHFARFRSRERALGKDLGQIFVGLLHDHIKMIPVGKTAAAGGKDTEQMRMRELRGPSPERELQVGGGTIHRDQFDGRFLRTWGGRLRQENGAAVCAAYVLLKREKVVDDLTFALFPDLGHFAPPTASSRTPSMGYTPSSRRTAGEKAPWRLRRGWNFRSSNSQAPGAGRSALTFWHEMGA